MTDVNGDIFKKVAEKRIRYIVLNNTNIYFLRTERCV